MFVAEGVNKETAPASLEPIAKHQGAPGGVS